MEVSSRERWTEFNDNEYVGNVGWCFANFGNKPKDPIKAEKLEWALKKNPAQIIGMTECQQVTEDMLRREVPAVAGKRAATNDANEVHAVAGKSAGEENAKEKKERSQWEYITMRGTEDNSNLLGVRNTLGARIKYLIWNRRDEGNYLTKTRKDSREKMAYRLQ